MNDDLTRGGQGRDGVELESDARVCLWVWLCMAVIVVAVIYGGAL